MTQSISCAIDCALEGPLFESLQSLAVRQLKIPSEESPHIRLYADDADLDWVDAALAFYKQAKFDKQACVRIKIQGIDTEGICRQFFPVVFSSLTQSSSLNFFDGPPNRLRPAFKASILSSSMLAAIGTMIAHSILMDGQGFPFLAGYCYYYMAGCSDRAITCITEDDLSLDVKGILKKVCES